jgi:hypothetical protein
MILALLAVLEILARSSPSSSIAECKSLVLRDVVNVLPPLLKLNTFFNRADRDFDSMGVAGMTVMSGSESSSSSLVLPRGLGIMGVCVSFVGGMDECVDGMDE